MKVVVKRFGGVKGGKFRVNFNFVFNYGSYERIVSDKEELVSALADLLERQGRYLDKEIIKEIVEEYMPPLDSVDFEINKALEWNADRYMKKVIEHFKKVVEIVSDEAKAITLPKFKEVEIDITDGFEVKINHDYDKCENCPLNEPPF